MFNLRYMKKLCVPNHDALKDIARHDVSPSLVEMIILGGSYCTDRMMTKGEIGMAVNKNNFTIFVKLVPSYSRSINEDVWLIKHVGRGG